MTQFKKALRELLLQSDRYKSEPDPIDSYYKDIANIYLEEDILDTECRFMFHHIEELNNIEGQISTTKPVKDKDGKIISVEFYNNDSEKLPISVEDEILGFFISYHEDLLGIHKRLTYIYESMQGVVLSNIKTGRLDTLNLCIDKSNELLNLVTYEDLKEYQLLTCDLVNNEYERFNSLDDSDNFDIAVLDNVSRLYEDISLPSVRFIMAVVTGLFSALVMNIVAENIDKYKEQDASGKTLATAMINTGAIIINNAQAKLKEFCDIYVPPIDILSLDDDKQSDSFKRPENQTLTLTKVSRTYLFNPLNTIDQLAQIQPVSISSDESKIKKTVLISLDEQTLTRPLNRFDECVFDTICSFILSGRRSFTARQIANEVYGNNPNSRLSDAQVKRVVDSIEYMRHTDIFLDWTEHAKLNRLEFDEVKTKDFLLPLRVSTVTDNGYTRTGFTSISDPSLLIYAKEVNQITSIESKLLNFPMNMDEEKTVLGRYLAKEIKAIKNKKSKLSRTRTIKTIFSYIGVDVDKLDRNAKKRKLDALKKILDYWIVEGFIKGYTLNKGKRNAIESVTFIV